MVNINNEEIETMIVYFFFITRKMHILLGQLVFSTRTADPNRHIAMLC